MGLRRMHVDRTAVSISQWKLVLGQVAMSLQWMIVEDPVAIMIEHPGKVSMAQLTASLSWTLENSKNYSV